MMFELKEVDMWITPETKDQLEQMLNDLGSEAIHGAMFMQNFIASQYQQGNILPPVENSVDTTDESV